MSTPRDTAARSTVSAGLAVVVLGANLVGGYLLVRYAAPLAHNRDMPWIVGRTLGMAAFGALVLLVVVGLWLHHPWRARWRALHAETLLLVHAALGAAVVVLMVGHVTALALDRYAGVGWSGALVPAAAAYRPVAVGLGVVAAYLMLAIAGTVALGGRVLGRSWRFVHHLSLPTFGLVWCHGLLAGSDAPRLRLFYVAVGAFVFVLAVTRYAVPSSRAPAPADPVGHPGVRDHAGVPGARAVAGEPAIAGVRAVAGEPAIAGQPAVPGGRAEEVRA